MAAKWIKITEESGEKTERLRLANGWLYRSRTFHKAATGVALVFIPDGSPGAPPLEDAEQVTRRLDA